MKPAEVMDAARAGRGGVDLVALKIAVHEALHAVERTRPKCLVAGAMLNDVQERLKHGQFEAWVRAHLPEIAERTARCWARAAANVLRALPPLPRGDTERECSVSAVLSAPEAELSEPARQWRRRWHEFTADKTIKQCLEGVFVDGDPEHRVDRAINGKVLGGRGNDQAADRKAFDVFVARHLAAITNMLTYRKKMGGARVRLERQLTPEQRSRITLSATEHLEAWPRWLVEALVEKGRAELRRSDAERSAWRGA